MYPFKSEVSCKFLFSCGSLGYFEWEILLPWFQLILALFISLLPFPSSQSLSLSNYGGCYSASTTCVIMQLINIAPLKIAINLHKKKYTSSVELVLFRMGYIIVSKEKSFIWYELAYFQQNYWSQLEFSSWVCACTFHLTY